VPGCGYGHLRWHERLDRHLKGSSCGSRICADNVLVHAAMGDEIVGFQ